MRRSCFPKASMIGSSLHVSILFLFLWRERSNEQKRAGHPPLWLTCTTHNCKKKKTESRNKIEKERVRTKTGSQQDTAHNGQPERVKKLHDQKRKNTPATRTWEEKEEGCGVAAHTHTRIHANQRRRTQSPIARNVKYICIAASRKTRDAKHRKERPATTEKGMRYLSKRR